MKPISLPPSLFSDEEWKRTVVEIKSNIYYTYAVFKKEERARLVKKGRVKVNLMDTNTWIKDTIVWYDKRRGWMFKNDMYSPTSIKCEIESLFDGTTKAFVEYMRKYESDLLLDPERLPRFINLEGIRLKHISDKYFKEGDFETIIL